MSTLSYQPWYTGCTYPAWDIPLNTDSGADDITNMPIGSFTLTFRNTNVVPNVDTLGTGVFSVKVLNPAEVYYKPSASDVSSPFSGQLIIKATAPDGISEVVWDPIQGPSGPFIITQS